MKQENRFVAELYKYLSPFFSPQYATYYCLDGSTAQVGVRNGELIHETIPDLWFTLVGSTQPTLIEAKVIYDTGHVFLMQSQLTAWRADGVGKHKPHIWVATNEDFDRFYFWTDEQFGPMLQGTRAKGNRVSIRAPKDKATFAHIPELALYILRKNLNG